MGNKTLKKLLLFFILLCIIVIIVFIVELFVLNRATEPQEPLPTDTSAPDISGTEPPSGNTGGTVNTSPAETQGTEPAEQTGAAGLYELSVPGGMTLLVRASEALFEHQTMDLLGDLFVYTGGEASLEISFLGGQDALTLAPEFLDNYIDSTDGEFYAEGFGKIGTSDLSGEQVIIKTNKETYESWLVDIEGGVLAFVINYRDDTQREALYRVLDSLVLTVS